MLAGGQVGEVEAVFVDHHGLKARPFGPCLLAHLTPDAGAESAGKRWVVEPFGFLLEFYAVNHAGHLFAP